MLLGGKRHLLDGGRGGAKQFIIEISSLHFDPNVHICISDILGIAKNSYKTCA